MELLSEQGLRLDGRKPGELRRIRCKLAVSGQADGSAYVEQGNTKLLAAVYGPHQVRSRGKSQQQETAIINCQYSMAVFSTGERKRRPRGDLKSQEASAQLKQAVEAAVRTELYPRSQIDVFIEVLQADGGNLCCAVNAATLALIDAGIPLKEYIVACSASLANGDVPLVDVNHWEEVSGGPTLTIAALPFSEKIALMEVSRRFHMDHMEKVLETALQGCRDIQAVLDEIVRKHIQQTMIL